MNKCQEKLMIAYNLNPYMKTAEKNTCCDVVQKIEIYNQYQDGYWFINSHIEAYKNQIKTIESLIESVLIQKNQPVQKIFEFGYKKTIRDFIKFKQNFYMKQMGLFCVEKNHQYIDYVKESAIVSLRTCLEFAKGAIPFAKQILIYLYSVLQKNGIETQNLIIQNIFQSTFNSARQCADGFESQDFMLCQNFCSSQGMFDMMSKQDFYLNVLQQIEFVLRNSFKAIETKQGRILEQNGIKKVDSFYQQGLYEHQREIYKKILFDYQASELLKNNYETSLQVLNNGPSGPRWFSHLQLNNLKIFVKKKGINFAKKSFSFLELEKDSFSNQINKEIGFANNNQKELDILNQITDRFYKDFHRINYTYFS